MFYRSFHCIVHVKLIKSNVRHACYANVQLKSNAIYTIFFPSIELIQIHYHHLSSMKYNEQKSYQFAFVQRSGEGCGGSVYTKFPRFEVAFQFSTLTLMNFLLKFIAVQFQLAYRSASHEIKFSSKQFTGLCNRLGKGMETKLLKYPMQDFFC